MILCAYTAGIAKKTVFACFTIKEAAISGDGSATSVAILVGEGERWGVFFRPFHCRMTSTF